MIKPMIKQKAPIIAEITVTFLKPFARLIAERGGKIISPVINIVPIILMPKEMIKAQRIANTVLKREMFVPVAFAKFSSNVIENIWL